MRAQKIAEIKLDERFMLRLIPAVQETQHIAIIIIKKSYLQSEVMKR